jgi:hypothetical protein
MDGWLYNWMVGWMDRHDKAKRRSVRLCEPALKKAEMGSLKPQVVYYTIRILKYRNMRSMTLIMQGEGINIYKMK